MGEPLGLGLAQMTGFHIKRYLPAGRLVHVLADVRLQVALTEITVDVLLQNADTVLLCATGGGPTSGRLASRAQGPTLCFAISAGTSSAIPIPQ